jgi:gluconolactonase
MIQDWKFEQLMAPIGPLITEGPVWTGRHLYFTNIRGGLIFRHDPITGDITQWRSGTRNTNGLAYDKEGRLYGCCSGGRSIVRFDADGKDVTIVDRLDGKRINTPNDLTINSQGRIWFSDPWNPTNLDPSETKELDHNSVLRADPHPDGSYTLHRATTDTTKPNGVMLSADEKTLYVAESGFARGIVRELRAYPILDDGSLGTYTTLFTWGEDARDVHRGIDGMCLDVDGNIIACTGWEKGGPGPLIMVFAPSGRVLETHPSPVDMPTNCCFGGPDMRTFYLTTVAGHLFKAETDRTGWTMFGQDKK